MRAPPPATASTKSRRRSRPSHHLRRQPTHVRAERPLARVAVRCAVLAAVVLLATVPVYVYVEPSWRALVARSASAFVLGVALLQLRRALADRLKDGGDS